MSRRVKKDSPAPSSSASTPASRRKRIPVDGSSTPSAIVSGAPDSLLDAVAGGSGSSSPLSGEQQQQQQNGLIAGVRKRFRRTIDNVAPPSKSIRALRSRTTSEPELASAAAAAAAQFEPTETMHNITTVMPVAIRNMSLRDAASAFHMGELLFTSKTLPNLYRTWDEYAVVDSLATNPELCFVCETRPEQGTPKMVAFLMGYIVVKNGARPRKFGIMEWVGVDPNFQRRGIGTLLFDAFCKAVAKEGVRIFIADTQASNTPARCFLNKMGLLTPTNHVYISLNLDDQSHQTPKADQDEDVDESFTATLKVRQDESKAPSSQTASSRKRLSGSSAAANAAAAAAAAASSVNSKPVVIGDGRKVHLRLRHMQVDDLYEVYALGDKVFTERSPNLHHTWGEFEVMEMFASDSDYCLVALDEDEKKVVGFCMGTTIEKTRSAWKYGYLTWMAVHPGYQGCGIAQRLFESFKRLMLIEKVRMLLVDTQADNAAALTFFSKVGFSHPEEHLYLSTEAAVAAVVSGGGRHNGNSGGGVSGGVGSGSGKNTV